MAAKTNPQIAELLLVVGAMRAELAALKSAAPVAPAPAPKRVDDWVPRYDACNFSRPVQAVFLERDDAFEYRAQLAAQVAHPVAVKDCRTPNGAVVSAVY